MSDESALTLDSIYLGSMKSRLSINFYDKGLERAAKGLESDGSWETWTRTELRTKAEYADQTAELIIMYGHDLGKVAMGILNKNLRFVVKKSNESNKRKRKTAPWWEKYIGDAEQLKFSLESPDRTVEKVKEWVIHSVSPSIAIIKEADPEGFENWFTELLTIGTSRLNEKHGMMISQARKLKLKEAAKTIRQLDERGKISSYEEYLQNKRAQALSPDSKKTNL